MVVYENERHKMLNTETEIIVRNGNIEYGTRKIECFSKVKLYTRSSVIPQHTFDSDYGTLS